MYCSQFQGRFKKIQAAGRAYRKMQRKSKKDLAMATYSIAELSRREILRMSAIVGVTSAISTKFALAQAVLQRTPEQILGPFYPVKPIDRSADLTRVPGRPGRAEGQILNVMGRVLNLKGEPVRNSKIEVWQANAHGRYTHPDDTNPAPLDPNFEGSAVLTTDSGRSIQVQDCKACRVSRRSEYDPARAHPL